MNRSANLLTAGLILSFCNFAGEAWARTQRPQQSARLSALWSDSSSNGYRAERRLSYSVSKKSQPSASSNAKKSSAGNFNNSTLQRPSLRERIAARRSEFAERRAAQAALEAREQQMQMQMQMQLQQMQAFRPVSPDAYVNSYQWTWGGMPPNPSTTSRFGTRLQPRSESIPILPSSNWEMGAVNPANDPWFSKQNATTPKAPTPTSGNSHIGGTHGGGMQVETSGGTKPETREKTKIASTSTKESAPKEEKKSGGEFDHLPFAARIPGKPGFVNLTGAHSSLPEIDVRGIASGTPVEIPDPNAPGSSIQFRVP